MWPSFPASHALFQPLTYLPSSNLSQLRRGKWGIGSCGSAPNDGRIGLSCCAQWTGGAGKRYLSMYVPHIYKYDNCHGCAVMEISGQGSSSGWGYRRLRAYLWVPRVWVCERPGSLSCDFWPRTLTNREHNRSHSSKSMRSTEAQQ
jgi:hypothetical protein